MLEFKMGRFSGYATKYSPYNDSRIAVAAANNFGLVGNGRLFVCGLGVNGIFEEKSYGTNDALYDVSWCEINENQLIAGSGDGTVKLFDTAVNEIPVAQWNEHRREVYATVWNPTSKDTFMSSSWDGTIKLWNPQRQASVLTVPTHSCTYSAAYSPHNPHVFSSVSSDSHLRVYDLRTPASNSNHLVHLIPIHGYAPQLGMPAQPVYQPHESLTHDWNKYRPDIIATGGVDTIIRTFDLRQPRNGPLAMLKGHEYAVRRLAWSPHLSDMLLSASYDMSCRVWTDGTTSQDGLPRQLGVMEAHTEFCTGVDWSLFGAEGWVATTSWDMRLLVWDARTIMGP